MQRPPRRFTQFFLGSNRSSRRGQVPYNAKRLFPKIGEPAVAGVYQGKFEPTYMVRRRTTLGQIANMARKAHQESIYAVTSRGNGYLIDKNRGTTRFTNRYLIKTPTLSIGMYQAFKKNASGGSMYQSRGGYTFEIGAYPSQEKETEQSIGRITQDFRSRGRRYRVMKR